MLVPARPHSPRPSAEHSALIDALGGPKVVAKAVSRRIGLTDKPLSPQAASMWRRRGIPYRYRLAMVREATERGVAVPAGFLGDEEAPEPAPDEPCAPTHEPDDDVPAFLRGAL